MPTHEFCVVSCGHDDCPAQHFYSYECMITDVLDDTIVCVAMDLMDRTKPQETWESESDYFKEVDEKLLTKGYIFYLIINSKNDPPEMEFRFPNKTLSREQQDHLDRTKVIRLWGEHYDSYD